MWRTIPDSDLTVDEIMRRWPATIRPFMRHRMLCIGCPIGVFHTVADACEAHGIDPGAFAAEILAATAEASVTALPVAEGEPAAERGKPPVRRHGA
jgi:hybrid cluster-associated redox disulfide protein